MDVRTDSGGGGADGGNYYSVPDRTRRIVEVHQLPDVIRILDQGRLVAVHPILEGRRWTRVVPEHRQGRIPTQTGPVAPNISSAYKLRPIVVPSPALRVVAKIFEFWHAFVLRIMVSINTITVIENHLREYQMQARTTAVGNRLRKIRRSKNLSQEALGRMLGRSKQAISSWESGRVSIADYQLAQLAGVLGCDLHTLLTGKPWNERKDPA